MLADIKQKTKEMTNIYKDQLQLAKKKLSTKQKERYLWRKTEEAAEQIKLQEEKKYYYVKQICYMSYWKWNGLLTPLLFFELLVSARCNLFQEVKCLRILKDYTIIKLLILLLETRQPKSRTHGYWKINKIKRLVWSKFTYSNYDLSDLEYDFHLEVQILCTM